MPNSSPQVLRAIALALLVVATIGLSALAVIEITRFTGGPSLAINQTSTNKQSTFDVTGESKVNTIPDQANVTLGITVNEATVKAAQDKANTTINQIHTQLATLGIEKKDIKTDNYSLYPNYTYQPNEPQKITGYTVNTSVVITLHDFSQLNQAIDLATGAGANQIGGISFSLSDDKKADVERQARQEAIDNAKQKAQELAQLAGMKLGRIVNVSEMPNQSNVIYPMRSDLAMSAEAKGGSAAAPTNVEPGSTNFSFTVTLSYETF